MKLKSKLAILFLLFCVVSVFASIKPSSEVLNLAKMYAKSYCDGQIDTGVPYFGPGKDDIAWVFTIFKAGGTFPSKAEILEKVWKARHEKLQAEAELEYFSEINNLAGIRESKMKIQKASEEMQDHASFATIYIMETNGGASVFAGILHPGLPLHYVAFENVKEKAKQALKRNSVDIDRYLFLNYFTLYAGFVSEGKKAFIHLLSPDEKIIGDVQLPERSFKPTISINQKQANLSRTIMTDPPPNWTPQIQGVPYDYYYSAGNCCLPIAMTAILGYWEKQYKNQCGNYDNIIIGGDDEYQGACVYPNTTGIGDGWEGLMMDEIAVPGGWTPQSGATDWCFVVAHRAMNDPGGRNYRFDEHYYVYGHGEQQCYNSTTGAMDTTFTPFCSLVDNGIPFIYRLKAKVTYYYDGAYITNDMGHSTVGIGYRNDGESTADHWRCLIWGAADYTPIPYWLNDSCCTLAPYVPVHDTTGWNMCAFMRMMIQPGGMHWSGPMTSNTTWTGPDTIYVEDDVTVTAGITLTISDNTVVGLHGNAVKVASNGTIIPGQNVTFLPDIRLVRSGANIGFYPERGNALNELLSGDEIQLCSNDTLYTSWQIPDSLVVSIADDVHFYPNDIRLIRNNVLIGLFTNLPGAFAAAQSGDEIHLASDDTIHTVWQIPAGITFKLTNEASLVLEGDLDVLYGATFLVDSHTYIKCYDHIDIQGGTMEIGPGARLEFDNFDKLKVKGILNAEGTSSDRIVFTSHNSDWFGICFYEECNFESSQLRYCEMSSADYGVWCNYTSPDVKHCLIHDNDIGIYGYYVDYHQKISDNDFEHNHDYGIAISQGNAPDIQENNISDGYSGSIGMAFWDANFSVYSLLEENEIMEQATGISGIRSDLQFKDNIIRNNSSYGIRATNGTWVTMEYPGGANNVICNNGRPGVYISSSGFGIMGSDADDSENSLYSNSTYQLQYKGDEPGDPIIEAHGNYWGGCPVNPSWIYGNVDYSDPLCTDPNATLSVPNPNIARTDAAEPAISNETTSTNDSIATAQKAAFKFVTQNNLNAAIDQFKWIVDNFPESEAASHALMHLNHCYMRLNEKSGLESYLESVCAKNRENDLVLTARYLLAPGRIRRGERKESLETYLSISRQTKNTELAADALFNAWQVCFNLLQDIPQAKEIYQTFAEKFGKDNRLIILQLAHAAEDHEKLMRTNEPIADLSKPTAESPEPAREIINEYRLYPNYPNPFNPHTTIGYQLPEAGMVRLKIYNLAGKLVRTLVESSQTAAYHQVQWDATDDAGNAVAAGIYLCQMQAGAFRQTQRLVLLK